MTSLKTIARRLLGTGAVAATLLAATFGTTASAAPIDKQLVVTVIQVCDNAGANCASTGPMGNAYFELETDKIWAQAGIDVMFVDGGTLDSTTLLNGADSVLDFTAPLAGPGTTMWLVNDLVCPSCVLYGEAYSNAGGVVINMSEVMAFNGGIGRLDTIAHELGHNLDLYNGPGNVGGHDNSDPNLLMAQGSVRNVPANLGQICPDGLCYSLLSADHIATARASSLLVDFRQLPEPGTLALVSLLLLGVGLRGRTSR